MNRREVLALMAASPLAASRAWMQTRPNAKCRVFLGGAHGLLLEPGGTLKTWLTQDRNDGLAPDWLGLGHNRPLDGFTLVPIPGLSNVVTASAGTGASFAVLADGRLLSWGWNQGQGVLGNTSLADVERTASWAPNSNVPVAPVTKFDCVAVSSQDEHVLALARDGSVYAWGRGISGELGIGALPIINFKTHTPAAMNYVPFPVRVPDLGDVTAISAGRRFSLALRKDGTVLAWGDNKLGTVGDGTTAKRSRPVNVVGVHDAIAIAAGAVFGLALLADGTVKMWGVLDNTIKFTPTPTLVPNVRGIRAIAGGVNHAAAITDTGGVMTWGANQYHQLGRGPNVPMPPGLIPGLSGVVSLAAVNATTTAVLSSGRIMTWGGVRPWTRPEGDPGYSPHPILLWIDGLDQS